MDEPIIKKDEYTLQNGEILTKKQINLLENNPHIEGLKLSSTELENIIKIAKHYYYNSDIQIITDKTFDILETILAGKKPKSNILKEVGSKIIISSNSQAVEKLPYYLGSLNKVNIGEKTLDKWIDKFNKNVIISEKLDGLTGLLILKLNNETNKIELTLFKHGDGTFGTQINQLLKYINIGEINMPKITKLFSEYANNIHNFKNHIALRGEIIIKKDIFNKKYNKLYPIARSLVAGMVNSKNPDNNIIKDMEIIFYELIYPDNILFSTQLQIINNLGLNVVKYEQKHNIIQSILPTILLEYKKNSLYDIDGIVLNDNEQPHIREIDKNPNYAVKFKMYLEEQTAITKVVDIEFNVSKYGILVPRIKYSKVNIKGCNYEYTTGFNLKYIVDNKINIGTEFKIIIAGDIIPYIYEILTPSLEPFMPVDIKWHWNETFVDAIIDDIDNNDDANLKKLISFFKIMEIDGIGDGILKKFINSGYTELKSILLLTPDIIIGIDGFKIKSATNIYNSIQKCLTTPQPLEKLMAASCVFGIGFGEKKFKLILDNIPDLLNLWMQNKITIESIIKIPGFNIKTANLFYNNMPIFINWLSDFNIFTINTPNPSNIIPTINIFSGMNILFTGFRDNALEKYIINNGGIISQTITKKVTLVIAKDIDSTSSKIQTAKELNIQIISLHDFLTTNNIDNRNYS